jgi:hypothetical protein
MLLECEGKASIRNPKPAQILKTILSLRSFGPSSYASLTRDDGTYLQVAGGGVTCLLESYYSDTGLRLRAFGEVKSKAHPDGTVLVFRAGEIPMMSDEWFTATQVSDVFCCFLEGGEFPPTIHWRPAVGF